MAKENIASLGDGASNRHGVYVGLYKVGRTIADMAALKPGDRVTIEQEKEALETYERLMCLTNVLTKDPTQVILTRGAFRWTASAMPVVELTPLVAAAFCVSGCETPPVSALNPPWECFVIEIDPTLIAVDSHLNKGVSYIHSILVRRWTRVSNGETYWEYAAFSPDVTIHQSKLDDEALFNEKTILDDIATRLPITERDQRALTLCRAIIRGVILRFANPEAKVSYQKKLGTSAKAKKARADKYKGIPDFDRYVITDVVKVDAREVVRRYNNGERSSPSVRTLVRGFYRNQHHGHKNALVKNIWIHPYWRGNETLPVATKAHRVSLERTKT